MLLAPCIRCVKCSGSKQWRLLVTHTEARTVLHVMMCIVRVCMPNARMARCEHREGSGGMCVGEACWEGVCRLLCVALLIVAD
jgi:hypothetical protein